MTNPDDPSASSGRGSSQGNDSSNNNNNKSNKNKNKNGNKPNQSRQPNRGNNNRRQRVPVEMNTNVDMRKYSKMITAAHDNFSDIPIGDKIEDCVICCKPNDVFGIGTCRHPVCAECSIRLRILCETKTCPVCRADIDIMSFTTLDHDLTIVPLPFPQGNHPDEARYGIRFSCETAGKKYEKYLSHVCKYCKSDDGERPEFSTFMSLRQHMANSHQRSYCHICTENLKQFSRERKCYTREDLQRHMRIGDRDDNSFKGHPQCLFCEQKFLDDENRYRHLRKEHFFCQFCESDGTATNVFYGSHDELKAHYKEKHFICSAEDCQTMGIAFATEFELNLHRTREHSEKRNLLDVGFSTRHTDAHSGAGRGRRGPNQAEPAPPVPRERIALIPRQQQPANPQSDPSEFTVIPSAQSRNSTIRYANRGPAFTPQDHDFPSLAPAPPPPNPRSSDFPRLQKVNKATTPKVVDPVEEFPSLGGASSSATANRISVPPLKKVVNVPKTVRPTPPKQHQPQTKAAERNSRDDDDFTPRPSVPQAVVKVNNSLLRFDMVDDSNRPPPTAKSNIQLVPKLNQPTPTASSSSNRVPTTSSRDFPSLPAAAPPQPPANSAWLNAKSKKIGSVITGVSVPSNYSSQRNNTNNNSNKKKKKGNGLKIEEPEWSSLGGPSSQPAPVETDEWKEVPLSKEAKAEKEKLAKKEEWARRKAEIRAAVAASSATVNRSKSEESEESNSNEEVMRQKDETPRKLEDVEWKEVMPKNGSVSKNSEKKNKKNKKKSGSTDSEEKTVEVKNEEPEKQETLQEKIDALWNIPQMPSLSSILPSLSFGNFFGGGSSSSSNTSSATPAVGVAPPPGLENVVPAPPPGIADISFASAPILSKDDLDEKRERVKKLNEKPAEHDDAVHGEVGKFSEIFFDEFALPNNQVYPTFGKYGSSYHPNEASTKDEDRICSVSRFDSAFAVKFLKALANGKVTIADYVSREEAMIIIPTLVMTALFLLGIVYYLTRPFT
ncbi:unnamed protein product [Caenorhabditis bovis]|uniref:RING-type E3 ubiquitin transferase n=1 Tax=Caenorhabditis bovis TaxID=2654633 RepID=A0A8S1FGA1_9PELO|nr:unnamed protein product [Caenorhabditis bovis]